MATGGRFLCQQEVCVYGNEGSVSSNNPYLCTTLPKGRFT